MKRVRSQSRFKLQPFLLCCLLWIALALTPGWAADRKNLLANPTMEPSTAGSEMLDQWRSYLWEGAGDIATKPVRQNRNPAAVISNEGVSKQAIFQDIRLPRCSYRLTALVAAQDMAAGLWGLTTTLNIAFDETRPNLTQNLSPVGDSGWSAVEVSFFVAAETKAIVYFFNYGSGRLFVDDVVLSADPGCAQKPDALTPVRATREPLVFVAPKTPADDLLAGYCVDPVFARRAVCGAVAANAIPAPTAAATARSRPRQPVILKTFDAPSLGSGPPTVTGPRAIAGGFSGVFSPDHYLALEAPGDIASDWGGYDVLRFEVFNASPTARSLGIEIWDTKTTNYWSRVNWSTFAAPGLSTLEVPLQIFVGEKSVIQQRRRLDLGAVKRLIFTSADGEIVVDDIRLEQAPKFTSLFPELIALDAGPAGSPVFDGFQPLTAAMRYKPERGYGFTADTRLGASQDRRHPDSLFGDWISILHGGLDFDLPNGQYRVWMMLEDPGYWEYYPSYKARKVSAQGQLILDETRDAAEFFKRYYRHDTDEDVPGDDIWERYVKPRYRPLEATVTVRDGRLALRFDGFGDPHATTLSALVIYPQSKADQGARFLDELWSRLKASFNRDYRQLMPPPPAEPVPAGNALGGALAVFVRPATVDVAATDGPTPEELARKLVVGLARGQIAPLTVALRSEQAMVLERVGVELPGFEITPYKIRSKVSRLVQDGSIYSNIPRLLDPLAVSTQQPLQLPSRQTLRLWIDVAAKPQTTPGHVSGKLTLQFAGLGRHELPIEAEVYPWDLPPADIPIGYLGTATHYPETSYPEVRAKRDAEFAAGLDLLARSGMTAVSGGLGGPRIDGFADGHANLDLALADMALAKIVMRFPGPALTYDGLAIEGLSVYRPEKPDGAPGGSYGGVLRDVLVHLKAHGKALGWPELVHVIGDEPDDGALLDTLAVAQAFRDSGTATKTALFTSIDDSASEVRRSIAGKIDVLYLNGHSESAIRAIVAAGSGCGLYNHRDRYERGIYLWKLRALGCRGHFQFAYNSVHADPWYDLDGREDDQVAVFTHHDGRLRPSLDLLRYREAITDYRTLLALERAIKANGGLKASASAQAWLDGLSRAMPIGKPITAQWTDAALEAVRASANQHTLAILTERQPR